MTFDARPGSSDGASSPDPARSSGGKRRAGGRTSAEKAPRRSNSARAQRERSLGYYEPLSRRVAAEHADDPKKALSVLFKQMAIPASIGRTRTIGAKRRWNINQVFEHSIDRLFELQLPIGNISDIDQKRMIALIRSWQKEDIADSTIQERESSFRTVLRLIGKDHVIPKGVAWKKIKAANGLKVPVRGRSILAVTPKGWADLGIDIAEVTAAAAAIDPLVGFMLEAMHAFGLRPNEAIHLRPARDYDVASGVLYITRGTKGGKQRKFVWSSRPEFRAFQEATIVKAIQVATKHPKGYLCDPNRDIAQMHGRLRYVLDKVGVTKAKLGITSHGLRHQFANDLFTELSGLPAPVLGLLPASAYQGANAKKVKEAYLIVSQCLGHERTSITGAYVGSVHNLNRRQRARLTGLMDKFKAAETHFMEAGVEDAWLVGAPSEGVELPAGSVLHVQIVMANRAMPEVNVVARLRDELVARTKHPCVVGLEVSGSTPEHSLEVFARASVESSRKAAAKS